MNELSGSSLEEQAASLGSEVADFDGITLNSYFADGIGYEPRVMGAISTTGQGVVSAPVKGQTGVYVVRVDDIQSADKQTAEGEKVRAQATAESMVQRLAVPAIQQMAEMRDLRGNISNRTTNRLLQTFRAGALMLPARIFCAFASVLLRGRSVAAVFFGAARL